MGNRRILASRSSSIAYVGFFELKMCCAASDMHPAANRYSQECPTISLSTYWPQLKRRPTANLDFAIVRDRFVVFRETAINLPQVEQRWPSTEQALENM
jgi:hypothetical protein